MKRWFFKIVSYFMGNCRLATEGATDYAEGAADPATAGRIRRHLMVCPACKTYRAQMQASLGALKAVPPEEVTAPEKDALLARFRQRKTG